MGNQVAICPDCGVEVKRRGLAAHRGSVPCDAAALMYRLRDAGYIPAGRFASRVRTFGFLVEWHPTRYQPGRRGRRQKVTDEAWVPRWLFDLLGASMTTTTPAERTLALEVLDVSERARGWARAELKLGEVGDGCVAGRVIRGLIADARTVLPERGGER